MRIRWTTRIAMAVGVITMVAGIAAGGGAASAAQPGSTHAGSHAVGYVTGGAGSARP
jgi:hypothetical protein